MTRGKFRVVSLFGLPICNLDMQQTLVSIQSRMKSGGHYQIATANLDFVRHARQDPKLHRVICDCAIVLPDGFPIVWASRLMQKPLRGRVPGSDLTMELSRLSAEKGYRIFLLGSTDADAQGAMRVLEERFPGVNFVGQYAPPPAPLDKMDDAAMLERIHAAKPDILLVAFGNPKQEFWIHKNLDQLRVPISIGIGGTLEMINGSRRRAPRWIQALNLEWLFRMAQEPLRLLPRYTSDVGALVRYFPGEILAHRLQWKRNREGAIHVELQNGHRVIELRGSFSDLLCGEVRNITSEAIRNGEDVTLDLSGVERIDADGLGCVMDTRRSLLSRDLKLYIVGANESLKRVFEASSLDGLLVLNAAAIAEVEAKKSLQTAPDLTPPAPAPPSPIALLAADASRSSSKFSGAEELR